MNNEVITEEITLKEAYRMLELASAIIVYDSVLVYPSLFPVKDDESNVFLTASWIEDGLEYSLGFREGDNKRIRISGSSMFLYDIGSNPKDPTDDIQITVLVPKILEAEPRYHLLDLEATKSNQLTPLSYTYDEVMKDIEEWNSNMGTNYKSIEEFNKQDYWRWEKVTKPRKCKRNCENCTKCCK